MAERRMFAKTIIDSDAFLDMPLSTQALYFHLSMRADDEGFINNPKKIQRSIGASEDDLKILIGKNFIIPFESGIVVVKHWRIHNYIQKDRYKQTVYQDERCRISVKDNGAYTVVSNLDTECVQDVRTLETQDSIGKVSIGKDSIEEDRKARKPIRHEYGEYKNVLLSDEDYEKLKTEFPKDYMKRIESVSCYCKSTGKTYKDYLATIRNWARRENVKEAKNGCTGADHPGYDAAQYIGDISKVDTSDIERHPEKYFL